MRRGAATDSGAGGWVVFAATVLALLGAFHAIAGLTAILDDDYFLVAEDELVVTADFAAWGWAHLAIGALVLATGFFLLRGAGWARVVTMTLSCLSAVINVMFLGAYPLWSVIMITLAILVVYAVTET